MTADLIERLKRERETIPAALKTYHGFRFTDPRIFEDEGDLIVRVSGPLGSGYLDYSLHPRRDLVNHSWEFSWGYLGSGPSQLAFAILMDLWGDAERARRLYQPFKFKVIARLEQGQEWTLMADQIEIAVRQIEAERGGAL